MTPASEHFKKEKWIVTALPLPYRWCVCLQQQYKRTPRVTLNSSKMFSTVALYSELQTWIQKRADRICWTHKPVNRQVSCTQMDCSHYSLYPNPWHFCWNFPAIINHTWESPPIVAYLIKSMRKPLNWHKTKTWENNGTYLIEQKHQLQVPLFWHNTL